jgi:hypothetical protein
VPAEPFRDLVAVLKACDRDKPEEGGQGRKAAAAVVVTHGSHSIWEEISARKAR